MQSGNAVLQPWPPYGTFQIAADGGGDIGGKIMRRKDDANRIMIDLTPGPARDALVQAANILTGKMHGVRLPWAQVVEVLAAFYVEANEE